MARTTHHRARARRPTDLGHTTVLHDLRYSAAILAGAARDGGRPRPQVVRRRVTVHRWGRHIQDPAVARWAAEQERQARQELRGRVRLLRSLVNQPAGPFDRDSADTVEVPPARHRHHALWLA